jgi:N-acetyl-anhydromuramyl-L-alanine amidase AmpD
MMPDFRQIAQTVELKNLQSRVRLKDDAKHHAGERGAPPAMLIWHTSRDPHDAKWIMHYLDVVRPDPASYHFLIDRDGTISRSCRPEWVAYHAGDSAWPHPIPGNGTEECRPNKGHTLNPISLGISWMNQDGEDLTFEQVESGLWLAKVYMERYDIPPSLNLGHKEVSPRRKPDPVGVDMDVWRLAISDYFHRRKVA